MKKINFKKTSKIEKELIIASSLIMILSIINIGCTLMSDYEIINKILQTAIMGGIFGLTVEKLEYILNDIKKKQTEEQYLDNYKKSLENKKQQANEKTKKNDNSLTMNKSINNEFNQFENNEPTIEKVKTLGSKKRR